MARPERLVIPGVAMHVRHRGVNREDCFREDVDRLPYLSCLKDLAAATGCAIHAYCLMTNHVHLLLTPGDPNGCATLMRELGQRYVPYFNRRHGRTGTLWEGRFRSCLVDSPASYRWSSYGGNSGLLEDSLLTPHVEYTALSATPQARKSAYRGLFDLPNDPELVKALRQADGQRVEPAKPGPKLRPDTESAPTSGDLFGELAP